MTEHDPRKPDDDRDDEPFLARWSRRKAQARSEPCARAEPRQVEPPAAAPPDAPPAVALPDPDQLDQDSDYSAFLTPGVDAELKRRALRKLFHSPKFNTFDGLDTYRDDFTAFPALGDVVTADMRHQLERIAAKLADAADTAPREMPAAAAAVASEQPSTATPVEPAPAPTNDHDHGDPA